MEKFSVYINREKCEICITPMDYEHGSVIYPHTIYTLNYNLLELMFESDEELSADDIYYTEVKVTDCDMPVYTDKGDWYKVTNASELLRIRHFIEVYNDTYQSNVWAFLNNYIN